MTIKFQGLKLGLVFHFTVSLFISSITAATSYAAIDVEVPAINSRGKLAPYEVRNYKIEGTITSVKVAQNLVFVSIQNDSSPVPHSRSETPPVGYNARVTLTGTSIPVGITLLNLVGQNIKLGTIGDEVTLEITK